MKKWIIIGIVAVIVLGVTGFLFRGKFTKKEPEDPTAGIRTATVERGDIDVTIDATGTIQPLNIVEVSSKASGKILELTVDAGDYVEKDELIARIETTYVDIDLEQAEYDLRAAKARLEQAEINITLAKQQSAVSIQQAKEKYAESQKQLEQLKEQIRIEKLANKRQLEDAENSFNIANLRHNLLTSDTVRTEDLKRAEASAAQAKSSLELAQKEFDRKENLFAKKYISQADLDDAKAKLDSAQAQHDSALQQVALVQTPASEAELALSEAEIKRAQFAVDAAKEQIDKEKYRDMEIEIQGRRVTQAKESLTLARANAEQITIRRKDLDSADAQVKRSESGLRLAKESLSDTEIRAPISGTILEKQVEEGQVIFSSFGGGGGRGGSISSEGQVLVTMADLSKVYVLTEVDETDIGKVKVGQLVTITVEAYPDQPYEGEVLRIAPQGQVVQNITTLKSSPSSAIPVTARGSVGAVVSAVDFVAVEAKGADFGVDAAVLELERAVTFAVGVVGLGVTKKALQECVVNVLIHPIQKHHPIHRHHPILVMPKHPRRNQKIREVQVQAIRGMQCLTISGMKGRPKNRGHRNLPMR